MRLCSYDSVTGLAAMAARHSTIMAWSSKSNSGESDESEDALESHVEKDFFAGIEQ